MRRMLRGSAVAVTLLTTLFASQPSQAQYTDSYQTNIISGVVSNWSGDYIVGPFSSYDALLILNGGVLSDANGYVGHGPLAYFNTTIVSGSRSVWNNDGDLCVACYGRYDQLVVANGGAVYSNNGRLGVSTPQFNSDSSVVVTGSGSVWSNRNDLSVEGVGGMTLTIADGGAVFSNNGTVGGEQQNQVLVTGKGSLWSVSGFLYFGGSHNAMIITNGGQVLSDGATMNGQGGSAVVIGTGSVWRIGGSLYMGFIGNSLTVANGGEVSVSGSATLSVGGGITVSGGALCITNGLGTALVTIKDSSLTLNSGTVTLDQLTTLDPKYSVTDLNGGVLRTKGTTITNNSGFVVGDGTHAATFILDTGGSGFHSFANGLTISSNGVLKGVGTIIGSTMVNGGGLLAPGLSPGSITFSNSLAVAPNSTFAVELDGTAEGQYDRIVALDTVSLSNSVLNVSLGFTPSIGDSFTIISNLGPSAVFGTFVDAQGDPLMNDATFLLDGTTFEISYDGNPDGQDVILTAVIPEPATWLLTVLGIVVLYGRRRLSNGSTAVGVSLKGC